MAVYRFVDTQFLRSYDVFPDGKKVGFFKDLRYDFAIVEDYFETETNIVYSGDPSYDNLIDNDAVGDIVLAGFMTDEQIGLWNLAAWFELFLWKDVVGCDTAAITNNETPETRKKVMTYHLHGHGVSYAIAESIANEYVTNGTKPSFRSLGLTDAPGLFRQFLAGRV